MPSLSSARQSQMAFVALTQLLTKHKSLLEHSGVSEKLCRCSIMLRESKPKVADLSYFIALSRGVSKICIKFMMRFMSLTRALTQAQVSSPLVGQAEASRCA